MSREREPDLSERRHIHIIGVCGTGMSPIAAVLRVLGHRVTGSDLASSSTVDRLESLGVIVAIGHHASNVGDADLVARSTAVGDDNPEVAEAIERNIAVVSRADILGALTRLKRTASVAGTHGKTTTASMLALVLIDAGLDPSFVIGAVPNEIEASARWTAGEHFVVEADESDGTFTRLTSAAGVVTSIEPDHLNHYRDVAELEAEFDRFVGGIDGPVAVCVDDAGARRLAARWPDHPGLVTYGEHPDADYRITEFEASGDGSRFGLQLPRQCPDGECPQLPIELGVPGRYNARNAAGAMALAIALGAEATAAQRALSRFTGVARRFQHRGTAVGVTFVDDYAHLPTEIEAVLEAAADGDWKRIVCVFQPHRYSRIGALWPTFAHSFGGADLLAVCDIYGAGEMAIECVTGKLIVDAVLDAHPGQRVAWLPERADLVRFLSAELRAGDLCLTLGAGDLTLLPDEVIAALSPEVDDAALSPEVDDAALSPEADDG